MATKLGIWNQALRAVRKPMLSALTDNVETRYHLTAAWDQVVGECAEAGLWNFGIVTVALSYDSGVTPIPGYTYGFTKPAAWRRTIAIAPDSLFTSEADFRDEAGKFFANITPLYLRYVSSANFADAQISLWPWSFVSLVAARLALEIAPALEVSGGGVAALEAAHIAAMRRAKNLDAMNQPTLKFREGSWIRSMRGNRTESPGSGGSTSGGYPDITINETGSV